MSEQLIAVLWEVALFIVPAVAMVTPGRSPRNQWVLASWR